jgi:hypothetical protein
MRKLQEKSSTTTEETTNQKEPHYTGNASVTKQKDDVVYISDPNPEWKFWSALRIGGDSGPLAIAISL